MDIRRLILITIFTASLFMLWEAWVKHNQPVVTPAATAQNAQNSGVPAGSAPAPAATVAAASASAAPQDSATDRHKAPRVVVETDLVRAEISSVGGDIIKLELLKHGQTGEPAKPFVLFDDGSVGHDYFAQSGLLGEGMPNHNTIYALPAGKQVLAVGQDTLELRLEAPAAASGLKLTRVLRFHRGSYVIDERHEVTNTGSTAVAAQSYFKFTRDQKAAENTGHFFGAQTFTGPAFYNEASKYKKVTFEDIHEKKAKLPEASDDGWVAMVQHYFTAAYLPQAGRREFFVQDLDHGMFSAGVILAPKEIAPGQTASTEITLYAGPQEQTKLTALAPGLDRVVDYGMLAVFAEPLFWVLSWLHKLVQNWGWAIIALTILIKLAFFPLSAASYKSMAKMKNIMPRMKRIQEQYKDDRMKMNQEMMELYKKEKVNPMGGCWPMLVQMPVFIALYWVLLGAVEMRQAPWLGWITDLSVKDPYFILPIIMGVTSLVQVKLNPPPPDPTQAKVMLMMPLVFTVMMAWFPAGLVLYWTVNNLLSIAQQWYITKVMDTTKPANA